MCFCDCKFFIECDGVDYDLDMGVLVIRCIKLLVIVVFYEVFRAVGL